MKRFFLPFGRGSAVRELEGSFLNVRARLDAPYRLASAVSGSGWVAALHEDGVHVHRWAPQPMADALPPIPFPDGVRALCVALAGDRVFVGGDREYQPFLARVDLSVEPIEWHEMTIDTVGAYKAIDVLVVDGENLLAIDNLLIPKWLFAYDLAGETNSLFATVELDAAPGGEDIVAAAVGGRWFAVLSSVTNEAGRSHHIALRDRRTLEPRTRLMCFEAPTGREGEDAPPHRWLDVALAGEELVIAAGTEGIGVLDLAGEPSSEIDFIDGARVRYGASFLGDGAEVVRVLAGDDAGTCIAVIEREGRYGAAAVGTRPGDEDARAALKRAGLACPYIPQPLVPSLMRHSNWLWSTRPVRESPYNYFKYVEEAKQPLVEDYALLAHDGHGVNSWALRFYLVHAPLRLLLKLPWGGAYNDAARDKREIESAFQLAERLCRAVEEAVAKGALRTDGGFTRPRAGHGTTSCRLRLRWRTSSTAPLLIASDAIPEDRRMVNALLLLTGSRIGEVAALRWRDLDETVQPLWRLSIAHSYDHDTKTGVPRQVPVHPVLAAMLAEWKEEGFARIMGRAPAPDDLIVPSREGRMRSRHQNYNKFLDDLARVHLRHRRVHDTRRTFITLCRVDGARKDVLEQVTHAPRGNILDLYTTLPWPTLCEAVQCLKVQRIDTTECERRIEENIKADVALKAARDVARTGVQTAPSGGEFVTALVTATRSRTRFVQKSLMRKTKRAVGSGGGAGSRNLQRREPARSSSVRFAPIRAAFWGIFRRWPTGPPAG